MTQLRIAILRDELRREGHPETTVPYSDDGYPCVVTIDQAESSWDQFSDESKAEYLDYYCYLVERDGADAHNDTTLTSMHTSEVMPKKVRHPQPVTYNADGYPCFVLTDRDRDDWDALHDADRKLYVEYYGVRQKDYDLPNPAMSAIEMAMRMRF